MKNHSKALVFFANSKQIPILYSADRGRAENYTEMQYMHVSKDRMKAKCLYVSSRSAVL